MTMNNRAEAVVAALEEFLDGREPTFEERRTWHVRQQCRDQIRARLVGAIDELLNDPGLEVEREEEGRAPCSYCKGRGTVKPMPHHQRMAISRAHARRADLVHAAEEAGIAIEGD